MGACRVWRQPIRDLAIAAAAIRVPAAGEAAVGLQGPYPALLLQAPEAMLVVGLLQLQQPGPLLIQQAVAVA